MASHKVLSCAFCFFFYIGMIYICIYIKPIPILFADNTSIHFTHSNFAEFNANIHTAFEIINTWFKENFLSLDFEKTHSIHNIYIYNQTLLLIYYSLFHSVISHRVTFWGKSYHWIKTFRMQKRVIKIIIGYGNTDSCRYLFKELTILPFIIYIRLTCICGY
jgi:hypothetical protein